MTSNRRYWLTGCLMAFALMFSISACATSVSAGPSTTLNVQMTDFSYTPTSFSIPAGQEITLNLKNNGKVPHEFVIIKHGEKVTLPFDDDDEAKVYWEQETAVGESVSDQAPRSVKSDSNAASSRLMFSLAMVGSIIATLRSRLLASAV